MIFQMCIMMFLLEMFFDIDIIYIDIIVIVDSISKM